MPNQVSANVPILQVPLQSGQGPPARRLPCSLAPSLPLLLQEAGALTGYGKVMVGHIRQCSLRPDRLECAQLTRGSYRRAEEQPRQESRGRGRSAPGLLRLRTERPPYTEQGRVSVGGGAATSVTSDTDCTCSVPGTLPSENVLLR